MVKAIMGCIGMTTEESVKDLGERFDRGEPVPLIGAIRQAEAKDKEDESRRLFGMYKNATAEERAIMDAVLLCLCGEPLGSIAEDLDKTVGHKGYFLREFGDMSYTYKPRPCDAADYFSATTYDRLSWRIQRKAKYCRTLVGSFHDVAEELERLNQGIEPQICHN